MWRKGYWQYWQYDMCTSIRNFMFCKEQSRYGPTEKDAILRSIAFPVPEEPSDQIIQNQLLLAMAASLGYMTTGLVRGFSSPGVPSMQKISPHLVPDEAAVSWISSIPPSGAFMGSLCAAPLMQLLGRRTTLMISSPIWVLGWCLIALSWSYEIILCGRILTGFCAGLVTPSAAVYVSECSYANIRGILGSLPALFMAGGILVSYVLGAWLPWNLLAWISAIFPALLLFVMLPLPESPTWLLSRGRLTEADKSLKWLHHQPRTSNGIIPVELQYTISSEEETPRTENKNEKETIVETSRGCLSNDIFQRSIMIPFVLTFMLLIFQQISGIDAIIFYTVSIFHSAESKVDDNLATILVGLVQLVSNFLSLFVIDRAGRKPLLIASGALMCISLTALGTHFHLQRLGTNASLGLLPLVSLIVFMIGFSIGYCSIPFLLMGELIPEKQRSFLSSIAGSLNLGMMFIVIKTYHDLTSHIGEDGTFWLYAVVCLLSCFFVYCLVPETKGKSLLEIEEHFGLMDTKQRKRKTKEEAGIELNAASVTKMDKETIVNETIVNAITGNKGKLGLKEEDSIPAATDPAFKSTTVVD